MSTNLVSIVARAARRIDAWQGGTKRLSEGPAKCAHPNGFGLTFAWHGSHARLSEPCVSRSGGEGRHARPPRAPCAHVPRRSLLGRCSERLLVETWLGMELRRSRWTYGQVARLCAVAYITSRSHRIRWKAWSPRKTRRGNESLRSTQVPLPPRPNSAPKSLVRTRYTRPDRQGRIRRATT